MNQKTREKKMPACLLNNLLGRQRNTFCHANVSRISASVSVELYPAAFQECIHMF
ncbi:hypothetical protein BS78_01G258700 [Paspalum vaginatum]|nr:hypothetical protein BS78_01G258700 [Paspalum vaginatum]